MFIIYGRKNARIKKFTYTQVSCKSCKSFDLGVKVYKRYFHIFFIPFIPLGEKTVEMRCNKCGEPNRDVSIQQHHEENARVPFYLYSGVLIIAGLVISLIFVNISNQKEKAKFVAAPQVGDVYRIRQEGNYYFLRLSQVNGDTVQVYHSHLMYKGFVIKMEKDDYFVKDDELTYTKKELKEMLEKAEINAVEREYSDEDGFNQIR